MFTELSNNENLKGTYVLMNNYYYYRIDAIAYSPKNQLYCLAVLLDVTQAFDKVWHAELLFKLKKLLSLPISYSLNRT